MNSNEKFRDYVEWVLKGLVNNPDDLTVEIYEAPRTLVVSVTMPENDVGQIIGRNGKLKSALQTVFWAVSRGKGITIEFNSK